MRVIQVGLGGFGRSWAEIVRAAKGVEFVAAVDPSPAARAWAIDALGLEEATVFADLERALDGTTDAVLVITPPDTHHAVAKSALRAGKHVLLEKPLATTFDEGCDLIRTAAAMDRILMVSQNYRYRPGAVVARQAVAQGLLGDLAAVRVRCLRDTRDLWPRDTSATRCAIPLCST